MKKNTFGKNNLQENSYNKENFRSNRRRNMENSPYSPRQKYRPREGGKIFQNTNFLETIKKFFLSGAFLKRLVGGFFIITILGIGMVYGIFLRDLPDITKINNPDFMKESTVVYDNDGNEIYRYGENGKRIYIKYEQISQSIIDALVSAEDQGFFENPGIDVLGLFRAGANYITGKNSQIQGTSTLSQQLIKNTLLNNERTIKRKIQEAYLAYQLNKTYSKQEILEMYLNLIEFGHGANGVEQASLTFFGKSAKDVGPLGATILASLPKSPTAFSPYSKRDRLMGKIEAYPSDTPTDRVTLEIDIANGEYASVYNEFKNYIQNLKFTEKGNNSVEICGLKKEFGANTSFAPNSKGCKEVNFDDLLNVIGNITVKGNLSLKGEPAEEYTIEYTVGRKDYVAAQMLRYKKINGETFGKILYDGLEFQFNKPVSNIEYPYFVMYVQEQLEAKYGDDINIKNGLKVYTTLRPNLQKEAEKIIREQVASNSKSQGASSASLIAMDNTTGEIVAMVGGPDYNDNKNNMTTALRQPGSSFKPLVYALAIAKWPIGPESPIADVKTKFGSYEPNNYDNNFKGIMSVGEALAYSRNIPAVKMYFLAGNEKEIIPAVKNLGITTLNANFGYGAPLSLGSGEVKAIDLMQAYSVFANNGVKREAYAIKRIEDSQGGIIEEITNNQGQQIFSAPAAYIVNKILSENNYRPESTVWRNNLTVNGKTVAAKTGTSNMENKKTGKIAPRDTWTIGYSPNITTVVWAGNVDGTALRGTCDGINCAAPAWKKFMTYALKDLPNTEFKKPSDIFEVKTAKLSGLLSEGGVNNLTAVKLTEKDAGSREVKIDGRCNGPVTDKTPEEAIIIGYTSASNPIIDRFEQDWLKGFFAAAKIAGGNSQTSQTPCEGADNAGNVNISAKIVGAAQNILDISWSGDRKISRLKVSAGGKILLDEKFSDRAENGSHRLSLTEISGGNIIIELSDVDGFKYTHSVNHSGEETENTPSLPSAQEDTTSNIEPSITVSNPARGSISVYKGDVFNLRFQAQAGTTKRTIQISVNGAVIQTIDNGSNFVIPIITSDMLPGNHQMTLKITDGNGKTDSKNISLTILER